MTKFNAQQEAEMIILDTIEMVQDQLDLLKDLKVEKGMGDDLSVEYKAMRKAIALLNEAA